MELKKPASNLVRTFGVKLHILNFTTIPPRCIDSMGLSCGDFKNWTSGVLFTLLVVGCFERDTIVIVYFTWEKVCHKITCHLPGTSFFIISQWIFPSSGKILMIFGRINLIFNGNWFTSIQEKVRLIQPWNVSLLACHSPGHSWVFTNKYWYLCKYFNIYVRISKSDNSIRKW